MSVKLPLIFLGHSAEISNERALNLIRRGKKAQTSAQSNCDKVMKGLLVSLVIITLDMKAACLSTLRSCLFQPPAAQHNYPNQLGAGISSSVLLLHIYYALMETLLTSVRELLHQELKWREQKGRSIIHHLQTELMKHLVNREDTDLLRHQQQQQPSD